MKVVCLTLLLLAGVAGCHHAEPTTNTSNNSIVGLWECDSTVYEDLDPSGRVLGARKVETIEFYLHLTPTHIKTLIPYLSAGDSIPYNRRADTLFFHEPNERERMMGYVTLLTSRSFVFESMKATIPYPDTDQDGFRSRTRMYLHRETLESLRSRKGPRLNQYSH